MLAKYLALSVLVIALVACGDDDAVEQTKANADASNVATATSGTANGIAESLAAGQEVENPGRVVYSHYCADCHNPGPGHPGTMRLADRLETGVLREREDLAPAYVKFIVRNGYQMMPAFRPSEIPDSQLDDLAAYVSEVTIKAMDQASE